MTKAVSTPSVFLVAAERSGDGLGAGLIRHLRKLRPDIALYAIGGSEMAAQGVSSDFDISPLSILGLTEALKAYPTVLKKVKQARVMIMAESPDAVILIDSWGFMVRLAKALKKAGYQGQIIKYVAPQVWAMRPGRAKVLARWVDHLLSIQRQDAPYFEAHGLPVSFVGNPMFDEVLTGGDGPSFRAANAIAPDSPLIALLFGSRPSEIERMTGPILDAAEHIRRQIPKARFAAPISRSIAGQLKPILEADTRSEGLICVGEAQKTGVFAAADAALACSGTVTTELASCGVPTVTGYILSPVTYFIAKRLFRPDYISLVNMSAGEALMPEFMQEDCNGQTLGDAVVEILQDDDRRAALSARLKAEVAVMKGEGGIAAQRAAEEILNLLPSGSPKSGDP